MREANGAEERRGGGAEKGGGGTAGFERGLGSAGGFFEPLEGGEARNGSAQLKEMVDGFRKGFDLRVEGGIECPGADGVEEGGKIEGGVEEGFAGGIESGVRFARYGIHLVIVRYQWMVSRARSSIFGF